MKKEMKLKRPVSGRVAKVPVVMQMEALECGAASLAMILAYYEKWIPLEQVRVDCGVSRDGSNAKNVLKAARHYGLDVSAYRMETEQLKESGEFPCIVHWEFNHFIVVDGFRNNKVYINDPARGEVKLSYDEFDEGFTGVVMFFEPSEGFKSEGKPKSMIGYVRERLKGAGMAIAFVIATSLISSLMGVISPGFNRVFMDFLLGGKNPGWIPWFIVLFAAFSFVQIVVAWLQTVYRLRINGKLSVVGNNTFLWKVLHMPMEFFSQRMTGDILMRQSGNASIASGMVDTFAPLVLKAIMLVFYLIVMLRYSVLLSFVGIFSIAVNFIMTMIISKMQVNLERVQLRDAGKLEGTRISGIEMIESIKASGAENGYFSKWAGYYANVNAQMIKGVKIRLYLGSIPTLVAQLSDLAILFIGVRLIVNGSFQIGMLMAFQGFLQSFEQPAMEFVEAAGTLRTMRTEMERIEDVMKYPTDVPETEEDLDPDVNYGKLSGQVSIRNLTFGYSRLADPLIENFNLEVKQGGSVALVGSSGCGKSTLAKLISGLYKPWSGEILFDGKSKDEINRAVFTGSLAVVDQDIIMFEDTIKNNIRMWDRSIEDFEVIMAAKDAQIHETITQRPGGYDYMVSERGKDFSGGEKQRMEMARVLAQDPTIIILDEATSALDARTEYEAVKAIKNRGITCIVIAHRLSTIRYCDEIIVLDHGKVAERGTHDELYAKGGLYTKLVSND